MCVEKLLFIVRWSKLQASAETLTIKYFVIRFTNLWGPEYVDNDGLRISSLRKACSQEAKCGLNKLNRMPGVITGRKSRIASRSCCITSDSDVDAYKKIQKVVSASVRTKYNSNPL